MMAARRAVVSEEAVSPPELRLAPGAVPDPTTAPLRVMVTQRVFVPPASTPTTYGPAKWVNTA